MFRLGRLYIFDAFSLGAYRQNPVKYEELIGQ